MILSILLVKNRLCSKLHCQKTWRLKTFSDKISESRVLGSDFRVQRSEFRVVQFFVFRGRKVSGCVVARFGFDAYSYASMLRRYRSVHLPTYPCSYAAVHLCNHVLMHLYIYVTIYLCIYLCMFVCNDAFLYVWSYAYMRIDVAMKLCIFVSMYLCIYISLYLCIYVSM